MIRTAPKDFVVVQHGIDKTLGYDVHQAVYAAGVGVHPLEEVSPGQREGRRDRPAVMPDRNLDGQRLPVQPYIKISGARLHGSEPIDAFGVEAAVRVRDGQRVDLLRFGQGMDALGGLVVRPFDFHRELLAAQGAESGGHDHALGVDGFVVRHVL
jgi:hypothetical protein